MQDSSDEPYSNNLYKELKKLYKMYPKAMITTYTYRSQFGIRTITDPRENTLSYSYDEFHTEIDKFATFLKSKNIYSIQLLH